VCVTDGDGADVCRAGGAGEETGGDPRQNHRVSLLTLI